MTTALLFCLFSLKFALFAANPELILAINLEITRICPSCLTDSCHIWSGLIVGCCRKDRFCFPHSFVRASNLVDGHLDLLENWPKKGEGGRSEGFLLNHWAKLIHPSVSGFWEGLGFGRCSQEWGGKQGDWVSSLVSIMDKGERDISRHVYGPRLVSSSPEQFFSLCPTTETSWWFGVFFTLLTPVPQVSLAEFGSLAAAQLHFRQCFVQRHVEGGWGNEERGSWFLTPSNSKL